jgi:predicted MFS family arabinose efflux permease
MADKPTSVVAAVCLGCVGVFAIMAQPILTAVLVGQLGMFPGNAGGISASEALGTALGPVAAMFWMQRVAWRIAAIVALAVVIVGNAVSATQSDVTILLVLRFAVGLLGEGTAFALAIAIISSTAQKDRNFAFLVAAQVVLGVVMFLMLPFPRGAGASGVFLPLAGFALIALATVGWIPQPAGGAGHQAAGGGSAAPAMYALLVMLVWCTGLGAVWAFVKLIGSAGGIEETAVGQALGLSTAIATVGALAASAIGDRFGRILPVSVALLAQAVMVLLLQGQMSWLQFAATAAVFQTFWNLTGPYIMGTVALSDTTGKVSLLIPTAQIGGFFLGPVVVGRFLADDSYTAVNYVGAACILLALALFIPAAARLKGIPGKTGH